MTEIKCHGQLYPVERSKSTIHGVNSQESCCRLKVSLFDGRADNDSIASDIRSETTHGDQPPCGVQNPSSDLYRQNGFEFYQG